MNTEVKQKLYVITLDKVDTFGSYKKNKLIYAMRDLFINIKNEVDKHYSIQEQLDFHLPYLKQLYNQMIDSENKDITLEDMKTFLSVYNELAPNEYDVDVVEIEPFDFEIISEYIYNYGLQNYKNNLTKVKLKFSDEKNSRIVAISKNEIQDELENLIIQELSNINKEYTSIEILEHKHYYLNQLIDRFKELEQNDEPIIVLEKFIHDYNDEYLFVGKTIELFE
ncbi:hypothetical protein [Staphylococcus haemolyticus]|uniref:hypothetical protein n=1 Tax=Staphylococcus haemolyticus TaxID=1283 RepID=UPI00119EEF56|nr:hypothetical protein [Staphylococcus haemolyticus]